MLLEEENDNLFFLKKRTTKISKTFAVDLFFLEKRTTKISKTFAVDLFFLKKRTTKISKTFAVDFLKSTYNVSFYFYRNI